MKRATYNGLLFLLWWAYTLVWLLFFCLLAFTFLLIIGAFVKQVWGLLIVVPLVCVPTGIAILFGLGRLLDFIRHFRRNGRKHLG